MATSDVQEIRETDVRKYRGRKGLTQAEFAKLVGVHANTIARVERTHAGNPTTLEGIARVMEISSNQLWEEFQKEQDPDEQQLFSIYRRLPSESRTAVLFVAKALWQAIAAPRGRRPVKNSK